MSQIDQIDIDNAFSPPPVEGCDTCSELGAEDLNECPKSQRPCGHHCNCSWIHDCCHWCGAEFGENGKVTMPAETP